MGLLEETDMNARNPTLRTKLERSTYGAPHLNKLDWTSACLRFEELEDRCLLSSTTPELLTDIRSGASSNPRSFVDESGIALFVANDGNVGYELWKSDGTSAGTMLVKDIRPGVDGSTPRYLTNVNGTLYFRANDGTTGDELWKSDGTPAGTVLVEDIRPGASGSAPVGLTNVDGVLLFEANDGSAGYELWESDG